MFRTSPFPPIFSLIWNSPISIHWASRQLKHDFSINLTSKSHGAEHIIPLSEGLTIYFTFNNQSL